MKTKKTAKYPKIAAKPLTEEQIKVFVSHYKKHKNFPGSKIPCSVTGKLTTCLGPWMIKKIKEFGGPENLLRNYKCRGALKDERKIIKPTMKSKKKQKINLLKDEDKNWSIPKVNFTPPRPLTDSEIAEASKTQCFRPDIFLSNDRHCDGCELFHLCQNRLKNLPKYIAADAKKNKKQAKARAKNQDTKVARKNKT
jgi:hypothetical protein